jgi:hypothetical protein
VPHASENQLRINLMSYTVGQMTLAAVVSAAGLLGSQLANAAIDPDFANPAIAMSGKAVMASGTCIAKYAAMLDDGSKPAALIGQRVAKRCAKEISRSAGLATWMAGKPDEFAKNLKYVRDDLTTGAVVRARAAAKRQRTA